MGTSVSLALIAHDKGSPNIVYQQLLWRALSAELDTESYRSYGEGRFLPRAFMQYGWDHYAPDPETRKNRYAAPLQTTTETAARPAADPHPDRRERRVARRGRGVCAQARRCRRICDQRALQRRGEDRLGREAGVLPHVQEGVTCASFSR
jgi:hypothetical protein